MKDHEHINIHTQTYGFYNDGGRISSKNNMHVVNGEIQGPKPMSKSSQCTFLQVLGEKHHMHPKFSIKNDFWTFQTHEWYSKQHACDDLQA